MTPPDSGEREKDIFEHAIEITTLEARQAFVQEACRGDAALLERMATLLRAHEETSGAFLPEEPASAGGGATAVALAEGVGTTIGRYKLLEKIGEGGFGTVYMAEQEEPVRRRVALKVIKLGMDTKEVVARFEAERQALAMMDHPNIARVLDGGATGTGRPYFVMELVKGVPITKYCDQRQLSIRARLELFILVCQAVQHAHQKGVIHRDLKPSNVLVTEIDDRPVPKVIDFGVARATAARLTERTMFTQFHQLIGTPAYMSPEQTGLGNLDIDTRSDIYALGVLLYELLTGQTPFDIKALLAEGYDTIWRTIREVEPLKPSTRLRTVTQEQLVELSGRRQEEPRRLGGQVQGDLDWIVMRCIEKDRRRRYDTAANLAQDLERHLGNEPIAARPASHWYRFRKTVRRHRIAFAAGAAIAAALVAGLAISAWSLGRERDARSHARRLLYAADMNLVQQAIKANNLGRARRLLDRHRPGNAAGPDLRGWEWRYLWQQTRSAALATVNQHTWGASSVSYAPDGHRFAVAYQDGRVELWDADTRRRLKALFGANRGRVAFSPRGDGFVATGEGGAVEWHTLAPGLGKPLCRFPGIIRDLAFSADGTRLVVTTVAPGAVHLVDPLTGTVLSTREVTISNMVNCGARLSPDNERLYYSLLEGIRPKVRCERLSDGKMLWEIDGGPTEGFMALELSPDGRFLATATGFDQDAIRVWDASSGAPVATLAGHAGWVGRFSFSADGRTLASASADQTVRLWETDTWTAAAVLRGHGNEVWSAALSADGKFLVSGDKDGAVLQWKVGGLRAPGGRQDLPGHVLSAWALPGGKAVLAMTAQRVFSIINLATLQETPLSTAPADRLFFVPPNIIAEYDGSERVRVSAVMAFGRQPLGEVAVGPGFTDGFAYLAEKRLFAWSDGKRTVRVVSLDAPGKHQDLVSNVRGIRPLNFTPDGRTVRATWVGRSGVAWDLASGQLIVPNDVGVLVSDRRTGHLGNANRPFLLPALQQFRPRAGMSGQALANDGRALAIAAESGVVVLYDAANPAKFTLLQGHLQSVDGVAFSPDSQRLATTSGGDEIVKLWDVGTQQELLTLAGRGTSIYAVEFTDDGNTLLVGRKPVASLPLSGFCQFWTVPSWTEIAAAESAGGESTKTR